jgi:hypothetical protein
VVDKTEFVWYNYQVDIELLPILFVFAQAGGQSE